MYYILVVENKLEVSELMFDMLALDGYEVDQAACGKEALCELKRTPVDSVIIDTHVKCGKKLINYLKSFC
jgi:DNA-binding response OmpR family regulator